jgi:hypothetical protein
MFVILSNGFFCCRIQKLQIMCIEIATNLICNFNIKYIQLLPEKKSKIQAPEF